MTSRIASHDDAWDALPAAALDALDPPEAAAVAAHLLECPACRAELDALRGAAAMVMLAAPRTAWSGERRAATRARLLRRVQTDKTATVAGRANPPVKRLAPLEWVGIAASLLLVASDAGLALLMHERATLRSALDGASRQTVVAERGVDSLRAMVAARDAMLAGLTGKDMAVVRLTSNAKREAWAMMFWNRQTNAWTFMAHDLPAPAPGRTYQLWLVTTANVRVSAGTFMPEANGDATVHATYALDRDALKLVAVTDEPAGGMPQPTGPFVVIGAEGAER